MSPQSPAPGLAQRFAMALGGLCDAVAARMSRPETIRQRDAAPLLMLLWTRLRRTIARFTAAVEGAVPPPPRPRTRPAARQPSKGQRLPGGVGWLLRLLPGAAACFGSQLQYLLTEPDMAAFLATSPQTVRRLRPLCRMLAVPLPETLTLRPRQPTPPRPEPPHPGPAETVAAEDKVESIAPAAPLAAADLAETHFPSLAPSLAQATLPPAAVNFQPA